jgi:hypothetical protein
MKIWCVPYSRKYRAESTKYEVNIKRRGDDVSVSFKGTTGGLSIPLDVATRVAHALLAAGSEDYKASWSVDEVGKPAGRN